MSSTTPIIAIVLKETTGRVNILIDPSWRSFTQEKDAEYIEALFRDLCERAKEEPLALLTHLSSLDVGPLITHETGYQISDHPTLFELSSRFEAL